uniref:Uncharacterized protein n=1 Tax=Arundo donax TaxID=35708 RepID=A0A0A9AGL6_ARUDO
MVRSYETMIAYGKHTYMAVCNKSFFNKHGRKKKTCCFSISYTYYIMEHNPIFVLDKCSVLFTTKMYAAVRFVSMFLALEYGVLALRRETSDVHRLDLYME